MFNLEIISGSEASPLGKLPEINEIMQSWISQVKHFRKISAKEIFVLAQQPVRCPLKCL